jgi:hypothetical protein
MFISSAEKQQLISRISMLEVQLEKMASSQRPSRRNMSPENRAKISQMMKERHAKQKQSLAEANFNMRVSNSVYAPYGLKKDGTPCLKPGRKKVKL